MLELRSAVTIPPDDTSRRRAVEISEPIPPGTKVANWARTRGESLVVVPPSPPATVPSRLVYSLPLPLTTVVEIKDVIPMEGKTPSDVKAAITSINSAIKIRSVQVSNDDESGLVLKFPSVWYSAMFMKAVRGRILSDNEENCVFLQNSETDDSFAITKLFTGGRLLVVAVDVVYKLACFDGCKVSYVASGIYLNTYGIVSHYSLDPLSSQDVYTTGVSEKKRRDLNCKRSMAYLLT